jgi:hypothetical protein
VAGDYEFFDPSVHAVWPLNRQLSTKLRAFVDFLADWSLASPIRAGRSAAAPKSIFDHKALIMRMVIFGVAA